VYRNIAKGFLVAAILGIAGILVLFVPHLLSLQPISDLDTLSGIIGAVLVILCIAAFFYYSKKE
jgi:hypothetical protein